MVRTKLVPKTVKIRQWPRREPYTQFKIKTLLPEQKTVQIKKKRTNNKKGHCQKKNSKNHGSLGKDILKNDGAWTKLGRSQSSNMSNN